MKTVSGDVVVTTNKKIRKKRRHRLYVRSSLFFFCAVVLIGGLSYVSSLPALRISSISVSGTEALDPDDITALLEQKFSGKYLFLFPKDGVLFVSTPHTRSFLKENFPRIEKVDTHIDAHTLLVTLVERQASYVWCGVEAFEDIAEENPCYYFDGTGFIFDKAPYFSNAVYFTLYDALLDPADDPLGGYLYDKDSIPELFSFVASLESLDIDAFALSLEDGEARLYLGKEKDPHASYIVWNIDDDYLTIGANLKSALSVEPMKSDVFASDRALEYIDLRFEGKVYYKMKN